MHFISWHLMALPEMLLCSFPPCGACSIDCTSYYELESVEFEKRGMQLSPELWLVKLMVSLRH
jgi:hypothetical protein